MSGAHWKLRAHGPCQVACCGRAANWCATLHCEASQCLRPSGNASRCQDALAAAPPFLGWRGREPGVHWKLCAHHPWRLRQISQLVSHSSSWSCPVLRATLQDVALQQTAGRRPTGSHLRMRIVVVARVSQPSGCLGFGPQTAPVRHPWPVVRRAVLGCRCRSLKLWIRRLTTLQAGHYSGPAVNARGCKKHQ